MVSWRIVLLVDEIGIPGENHRPAELTTLAVICILTGRVVVNPTTIRSRPLNRFKINTILPSGIYQYVRTVSAIAYCLILLVWRQCENTLERGMHLLKEEEETHDDVTDKNNDVSCFWMTSYIFEAVVTLMIYKSSKPPVVCRKDQVLSVLFAFIAHNMTIWVRWRVSHNRQELRLFASTCVPPRYFL